MNNRPNRPKGQGPFMGLLFIGVWLVVLITLLGLMGSVIYAFDFVNHLRPIWTLFLAVALAIFTARKIRRKRIRNLALFGLAVNLFFLAGPVFHWATAPAAITNPQLVIAQLNANGSNTNPEAVLTFVRANQVDVLLVQGVNSQKLGLLNALSTAFPHQFDCADVTGCHLAIMSRHPLSEQRTWHRSVAELQGWSVPAVSAKIQIADQVEDLNVIVTHLARPSNSGLLTRQLAELKTLVTAVGLNSTILAGDFNLTPWAFAHSQLPENLGLTWIANLTPTWPAPSADQQFAFAILPLDHFFVSSDFTNSQVLVGEPVGSEHYPLILRLGAF